MLLLHTHQGVIPPGTMFNSAIEELCVVYNARYPIGTVQEGATSSFLRTIREKGLSDLIPARGESPLLLAGYNSNGKPLLVIVTSLTIVSISRELVEAIIWEKSRPIFTPEVILGNVQIEDPFTNQGVHSRTHTATSQGVLRGAAELMFCASLAWTGYETRNVF